MKLLFLTGYNLLAERMHFFNLNVLEELFLQFDRSGNEVIIATILDDAKCVDPFITEETYHNRKYYKLHYSSSLSEDENVDEIVKFFQYINPDVIHSNMVEVIDVLAAKRCNIPIVLTIPSKYGLISSANFLRS